MPEVRFLDVFEPIALTGMGVALVLLSIRLYRAQILRMPAAVSLGISGFLAVAWKYPDLMFMPDELRLPFEIAQVQFFVALSICMTLFALEVFIGQARALAKAEEMLALQAAELEKTAVLAQMAAIIESSDDAIVSESLEGEIVTWNTSAERIFGCTLQEAQGRSLASFVEGSGRETFHGSVKKARAGQTVQNLEVLCETSEGQLFQGLLTLAPIKNALGYVTGVSVVAKDLSESKRAEEMEHLAVTDELTGLSNRRGFLTAAEEMATKASQTGKGFTVLFADLNGLKEINDNLGHQEGDAAICDAAEILRSTFRDSDVIGRLGGDEFCILLTDDKQQTESPITRLQAMTDIHNLQSGRPFKVSMSVGTAVFDPSNPKPMEELIERADQAMYEQKMTGPRRYKLLVGDDDPSICSLAEAMFSDEYDVTTAFTGKQVVEAAETGRPDLVLLDLHLPDMLGTEVVRQMRANPNTKLTPVIMITGAGDQSSELDSLRAGVDDYVEKPFDEDKLRARMEIALKRKLRR